MNVNINNLHKARLNNGVFYYCHGTNSYYIKERNQIVLCKKCEVIKNFSNTPIQ